MRTAAVLIFACVLAARGATVARMACGGTGGTDPAGNVWAADSKVGGGAAWTIANQPALASQPVPYQALCYSTATIPFSRAFTVPAGNYSVTLKWIEPNKTAAGQRTFTATINGAPVAIGLDIFSVTGGALKPYDQTYQVAAPGGSIQVTIAGVIGNGLLSAVQIDSVPAPDDGVKITCTSGTATVGQEINADGPSQEVTIFSQAPATTRWDMITVCPTVRFLGQTRVTMSIGRPGTNDSEMSGAEVPLEDSSNNSNCWTARPAIPQLIGAYDVVVKFAAYTTDASGQLAPGNLKNLTQGVATWEACYYQGKIGNVASTSKPVGQTDFFTCSGAYSHVDPQTGQTLKSDCAGIVWAKSAQHSVVGVEWPYSVSGNNPAAKWSPAR